MSSQYQFFFFGTQSIAGVWTSCLNVEYFGDEIYISCCKNIDV
jgi:hypothetical protein